MGRGGVGGGNEGQRGQEKKKEQKRNFWRGKKLANGNLLSFQGPEVEKKGRDGA